jgi:hypothetical protein
MWPDRDDPARPHRPTAEDGPRRRRRAREPRRDREIKSFPGEKLNRAKQKDRQHMRPPLNPL